jgi:hypothetical protein
LAARVLEDVASSSAGNYFLIEFPTLMYLMAFSALAAFWLFLLHPGKKIVFLSYILFNVFVCLVFLLLIILFLTLPDTGETPECISRQPTPSDNTNSQIVSIVYQGFIAGAFLFVALTLGISGGTLFFGLKKRDFENKVAMVTLVCTAGLLLHCGLVLYLSVTFEDDFTIAVLMIVLAELLPIGYIMGQFSIMRAACLGKAMKIPSYHKPSLRNAFKNMRTRVLTATTSTSTNLSSSSGSKRMSRVSTATGSE